MTAALVRSTAKPDRPSIDLQAQVRAAYHASVEAGESLTGAELGRRFGRTDRWGRLQLAKLRNGTNGIGQDPPPQAVRDRGDECRERRAEIREAPVDHRDGSQDERALTPTETQPVPHERLSWLDTAITVTVGLVAAAASYGHMLEVALLAGEPLWIARAFPSRVDGLVFAALRRGEVGRRCLALGVAVSMAANVLAQFPEHAVNAGPVVSAWPPLALYGTHHLLVPRNRDDHHEEGADR